MGLTVSASVFYDFYAIYLGSPYSVKINIDTYTLPIRPVI